jgi:uncharacterized protein YuzE
MKVYYDKQVDAAYLRLSERQPDGVVEMAEGVNLDVTDDDEIVGIEILNASRKLPLKSLFVYELDEAAWPAVAA